MHGGDSKANNVGAGSASAANPGSAPTQSGLRSAGGTRRLRVLLVDDERDSLLLLAKLFDRLGHEVRTATDGLEALEVAAAFKPELTLLNIDMPRMDGYEACRRIRQQPWGQTMVLAAYTGYDDDGSTRQEGFNLHLVKPVRLDTLVKLAAEVPTPG